MKSGYDIIIIGSGICGTSLAFHLAKDGAGRILVLEQGALCSGTTSHAPGLAGQLRADPALMRILRESVAVYEEFGEGAYQAVGSLRLASSLSRLQELREQKKVADGAGLECSLFDPDEIPARFFPHLDPSGVEGALWIPSDGSADAIGITSALRRSAQRAGVEFRDRARVTGLPAGGVEVEGQLIEAPVVVIATGIWSASLGRIAGVELPVVPIQHQVVWTQDLQQLQPEKPVANLRDPDHLVYFRQDGARLVVGGYERDPRPFNPEAIPKRDPNPSVRLFDAAHFRPLLENASLRVPLLRDTTLTFSKTLNGLESFTPDGHFLLGPFPQKPGLWAACGFCAHGVSGSGGVGKVLAKWILGGQPPFPLHHMEVARFQDTPHTFDEAAEAVCGIYSSYYDIDRSV